jgi:hypothetical protein
MAAKKRDGRDVFLFTVFVLLLIVVISFLAGYFIGTRLL